MYNRAVAAQTRQAFWTVFGQYMAPQTSAEGERINWVNYKTGEKHIRFVMAADTREARIAIALTHPDLDLQQLYFQQFEQHRNALLTETGEEWQWQLHVPDESGRIVSHIGTTLPSVSIMNRAHWPQLIQFFKPRIRALDAFWSNVKYGFEALR